MSRSRHRNPAPAYLALSCIGLASTGLAATSALAQDAAGSAAPARLGGVTVTGAAIEEDGYKTERLDSPKATAPLVDTPRSITVVPRQLLQDTATTSLGDALRTVPGITLGAGEGGNPQGDRPFIRGVDSQNSIYLDGVRDIGAQSREVFAVEQIEITKGSDSVTGGRGNAGGAINLVTKVPQAERFVAASASLGTDDYKRGTVDINQPLNGVVGVRLNAMWHDQDIAGRDALWSKRWGVAPSVRIGLEGPTSLTLSYYHLESDELPDSGIPYAYTIGNAPDGVTETTAVKVRRGAFYGLVDRDFRKTNVDNLTARFEHEFANGFTLRNTLRYGESDQGYVLSQPDDSQGNVANGYVWRRVNSRYSETWGLIGQTDLAGEFSLGAIRNSFALSVEYSEEHAVNGNYVSNAATGASIATGTSAVGGRCGQAAIDRYNCTSLTDPDPYDPWISYASDSSDVVSPIERSLRKTWTITKTTTKAVSLFDTIHLSDALMVNLGGRYDRYETKASPGLAVDATDPRTWYERNDDIFTYQAGVVFKPAENGSLYVSTMKAATPPGSYLANGSESNGITPGRGATIDPRDLKVEKTTSYEIGTKWNLFGEALALSLAAFRSDTDNARATDANGLVAFIGEKRIDGIEFGFSGNVTEAWSIFGGYTYMDSEVRDGGYTATTVSGVTLYAPSASTGRRFPNTPKHSFTAFTEYKVTPAFTLGGGATYMSKVYGGYSDLRTIENGAVVITKELARYAPSYWRFDANASYRFNEMLQLQVNVQNMFDKRYFDKAYASHYVSQAAGRTAIATLNVRF